MEQGGLLTVLNTGDISVPTRILIADDNGPVRFAIRQVLEDVNEHWEFAEAENGEEAITKALALKPNLVIMDMVMPLMDGLAATREITNLLPNTPVLLHTLYWSPEIEIEAGKVGVRKTVPKSDRSVLVSAVEQLLHSESPEALSTLPEAGPADTPSATRRRTVDRIRELCAQLFAVQDDEAQEPLLVDLRRALHEHIENIRSRIAEYPAAPERRVRTKLQPAAISTAEQVSKDPNSPGNVAPKSTAKPEPPGDCPTT
jgi:NarL family two-component system response regulator LiaR